MQRSRWTLALLAALGTELSAQTVLLELRPRDGDTLRMRLDQSTEMIGGRRGSRPMRVTTTLTMFSRAIVESRTATATLIYAITDSVDVTGSDAQATTLANQAQSQLVGRKMRLRLSPDGIVSLADSPRDVPKEVNDLLSVMPASFPTKPVAVGDTWMREMPIPAEARLGVPAGGVVRSTFRLDSVSRDGRLAYVGMRGVLQAAPLIASTAEQGSIGGSIDGNMIVDRRRGWLSESRFRILMRTTVGSKEAGGILAPMTFRTTITQRMRILDKPR